MNKQNAFLALASWALMAFPASADDLASSSCPYHATSHSVLVFPMGFDRFLDVPDVRVAVPEGYIRPYERERYANDGTDGAARLFVEVPSLAPMFLQEGFSSSFRLETTVAPEDQGTLLLGPGLPLKEFLASEVEADAAARAIQDGDTTGIQQTGLPEGLRLVPGALLGQTLVAIEDGAVTFLANCQDGRVPICTGRVSHNALTAQLTFRRTHLDAWRELQQRTNDLLRCFLSIPSP